MKSAVETAKALSLELEIDQLRDEVRALRADALRHAEERIVYRYKILRAASGGNVAVCSRCADVVEAEVRPVVLPQM